MKQLNKKILLLINFVFLSVLINVPSTKSYKNYSNVIDIINNNLDINRLKNITYKLCENHTRITGSIYCNYSAYYIQNIINELNFYETYLQPFKYNYTKTVYNVVSFINNYSKYNSYCLIMAHYDTISYSNLAPGGNDNAASISCIFEILRLLKILLNGTTIIRGLIFLATTGEEQGLYGSRIWIKQNNNIVQKLLSVINFDMIGYGSYHTIIYNDNSEWLSNFIVETSNLLSIKIVKSKAKYPINGRSDHINFMYSGISTVWIFEKNLYYPYMHTPQDTPDKVNYYSVGNCAKLFTLVLYRLLTESVNNTKDYYSFYIIITFILITIPLLFKKLKLKRISNYNHNSN